MSGSANTEKRIEELDGKYDEAKLSAIGNFYCLPYLNAIDVAKTPQWRRSHY